MVHFSSVANWTESPQAEKPGKMLASISLGFFTVHQGHFTKKYDARYDDFLPPTNLGIELKEYS